MYIHVHVQLCSPQLNIQIMYTPYICTHKLPNKAFNFSWVVYYWYMYILTCTYTGKQPTCNFQFSFPPMHYLCMHDVCTYASIKHYVDGSTVTSRKAVRS